MKPLALDTSVSIPLMVKSHPLHDRVVGQIDGRAIALAGHAEIETLSVLTRLPGDARPDRAGALLVLTQGLASAYRPVREHADTEAVRIAALGVRGGAVFDALVALAAVDNDAVLVTRDRRALPTYAQVGVTVELLG